MATDVLEVVQELSAFYDFTGKTVVNVGAGGGQLVEYARPAHRVVAVDRDAAALAVLAARLAQCGLADRFELVAGDFQDQYRRGDIVLFEFCLHQMSDPERALAHARELAPEVAVIDHAPGSPWEWHAGEERGVEAAWRAVERHPIRRQEGVEATQDFPDYAALAEKLRRQGPESQERILRHRGRIGISIPMPYRMALL